MTPKLDYSDVLEAVKNTHAPLVTGLLDRIRQACEAAGMTVKGPFDMCDDMYQWSIVVNRPGEPALEDCVDVTVEIVEQRACEGGYGFGINFGINIVEYGGSVLGGYQPYNYTPDVWVDARDPEAVAARWQEFAGVDATQIPPLIMSER